MATVTLSGSATVTIDGRKVDLSGQFTATVDEISEQTIEVDTTYVPFGPTNDNDNAIFWLFVNSGSDDAIVRLKKGATARYLFVTVPAGAHALLSSAYLDDTSTTMEGLSAPAARAINTNTRLYVMIGRHN